MCRVLYLPKKVRPPQPVLEEWLWGLEKSFGGDGNGYATLKGGVKKGVKLSTDECAAAICNTKAAVVFHTRKTSIGGTNEELCHPFETSKGYLIHNGHWNMGAFAAGVLNGTWSDTKVAALHIGLHGWKSFVKKCNSGVWIHLSVNGLQVLYESGTLYVEFASGALCSEPFAAWGKWYKVKPGAYSGRVVIDDTPVAKPKFPNGDSWDWYDESEKMFSDAVERRLEALEKHNVTRSAPDPIVSDNTRQLFSKLCDYPRCMEEALKDGRCGHHARLAPLTGAHFYGGRNHPHNVNHHPSYQAKGDTVTVVESTPQMACLHITPHRYLPEHMREAQ